MAGSLLAPTARLATGWHNDVLLEWDEHGTLTRVSPDTPRESLHNATGVQRARGPVLPGMPNLHSHAFQAAMAGLTEYRAQQADSFWSWRDLMYRFAARLTPDAMAAIAHGLYIDMLKTGYTSVCEFHYLHHQPDGQPYPHRAELAARVLDAAEAAGMGMTMLPVLYQYSNFGSAAPRDDQRRFLNRPDELLTLLTDLQHAYPDNKQRHYGVAPHSLRAVSEASLTAVLADLDQAFPGAPVHIHIAEQTAEVQACLDTEGARPVQWLLDHFDVNDRWCLVHATHIDEHELHGLARSGAVAGLCLTTEANLGDGIFPAADYLSAGGRFGIGSDSHVSIDWRAELRLLEYGQRLLHRQRNVLASSHQPHVADHLFDAAIRGGALASGRAISGLQVGNQADFMVLDNNHISLAEPPQAHWLSGLVFNERGHTPVRDVYVSGRQRIADGHHPDEDVVYARYRQALSSLLQQD
ncbi:MAG TPA: formimidoylglutamate deiminase [Burkholderiaceae bacterium]|nr:formimidoylglutamate deiminase [Burkholderiaceae bacterium]